MGSERDRWVYPSKNRKGESETLASANPATLLRRITLDLTGLPPTPEEYDAFRRNADMDARIAELMDSPRYGEHMAWRWLDAARYADSDGYESDPLRNMWPWRDWVVESFNSHMPYDRFIMEQLAGDQIEDPSLRQILATGFNRNHRLNNEGGVDPEEWLIEYVCDRAETTATVFMGLTWQCARCHDHKFDPISAKEYYGLFAFFHQLPEIGNGRGANNAPPMIEVSSLEHLEEFAALRQKLEPLEGELKGLGKGNEFSGEFQKWLKQLEGDESARKALPGNLGKKAVAKWDAKLKTQAREHFLRNRFGPARSLREKMRPLEKNAARLRATGAKVMVMGDLEVPRKSYLLRRGAFDQPGEEVGPDTPSLSSPDGRFASPQSAGVGPMARGSGTSVDRPGRGQSNLGTVFRHGIGEDARGLRFAGSPSLSPRITRFSRESPDRNRLGFAGPSRNDSDECHLSTEFGDDAGTAGKRSRESLAGPRAPIPASRSRDSGSGSHGERIAR